MGIRTRRHLLGWQLLLPKHSPPGLCDSCRAFSCSRPTVLITKSANHDFSQTKSRTKKMQMNPPTAQKRHFLFGCCSKHVTGRPTTPHVRQRPFSASRGVKEQQRLLLPNVPKMLMTSKRAFYAKTNIKSRKK